MLRFKNFLAGANSAIHSAAIRMLGCFLPTTINWSKIAWDSFMFSLCGRHIMFSNNTIRYNSIDGCFNLGHQILDNMVSISWVFNVTTFCDYMPKNFKGEICGGFLQ